MVITKEPGVYFTETTNTTRSYSMEYTPLFIIETASVISGLDGVTTEFDNFNDFATLIENKGLDTTKKYIQDILNESGKNRFYIHSVKNATSNTFSNILKDTTHLEDVTTVIYVEETPSSSSLTLKSKISDINTGLEYNYEYGIFRIGFIIPYGTVKSAETGAGNTPKEETAKEELVSFTSNGGFWRICITPPDTLAGINIGKCIGTSFDEEAGFTPLTNIDLTDVYKFNHSQRLALQTAGIIYAKPESIQGIVQYRVNLGVTTKFKEINPSGMLISRTVADELLRRVKFDGEAFIKDKEREQSFKDYEIQISNIVQNFVNDGLVDEDETQLTLLDGEEASFAVVGQIKPVKSLVTIEVNTKLI